MNQFYAPVLLAQTQTCALSYSEIHRENWEPTWLQ